MMAENLGSSTSVLHISQKNYLSIMNYGAQGIFFYTLLIIRSRLSICYLLLRAFVPSFQEVKIPRF